MPVSIHPKTQEAIDLFLNGADCLSRASQFGFKIDLDKLSESKFECKKVLDSIESEIREIDIYKDWESEYGNKLSYEANDQILFLLKKRGYTWEKVTKKGKDAVDKEVLTKIDIPFTQKLLRWRKFNKLLNTYFRGIEAETINGYVHTNFLLHSTVSGRSSSTDPNFQNMPIRDKEQGKYIRSLIIPRGGCHIVELDYKALEVFIATCYHRDPTMIKYNTDPTTDMHRDASMDLFKVPMEEMSDKIRYFGKNRFVFPVFYGSIPENCAKALWESVDGCALKNGTPLRLHLNQNGLADYDSFLAHVKSMYNKFWNERFAVYTKWKEKWYWKYRDNGYFDSYTGFRYSGEMKRNAVLNYPIQGSAFHCQLWSFCKITKRLDKLGMKSRLIGQIHDSIIANVPECELEAYIKLAKEIMTKELMAHWKWIIVPLEVEADVSPVNCSWFEKKKYKL